MKDDDIIILYGLFAVMFELTLVYSQISYYRIQDNPPTSMSRTSSFVSFMSRLISEPGNPQYCIMIMSYLSYQSFINGFPLQWIIIQYLCGGFGLIICVLLKHLIHSKRPVLDNKYIWDSWLKEHRDTNIPSGHSYIGIVVGLSSLDYMIYSKMSTSGIAISMWFLSLPIFRYVGLQHTITGVVSGVVIGVIIYGMIRYIVHIDISTSNQLTL